MRRTYLGKSYDVSWIPEHIQEHIENAINNGMSERNLKLVLGNAKVCHTIIEQEENEEIKKALLKEFPENTWFCYPKIRPYLILEKQRELRGLAPNLVQRKIPLHNFLEGEEYLEDSKGVTVSPTVMRRIVKFFLDNTGRYVCIEKGKTVRGKEEVYVVGEIAKSKKPRYDFILLDKYHHRQRK